MSENETNQSNQTQNQTEKNPPAKTESNNPPPTKSEDAPKSDENLEALKEAVGDLKDSLKLSDGMKSTLEDLPLPKQLKMLKALRDEKKQEKEKGKQKAEAPDSTNPAEPKVEIEPKFKGFLETNDRNKMLDKLYKRAVPQGFKDIVTE